MRMRINRRQFAAGLTAVTGVASLPALASIAASPPTETSAAPLVCVRRAFAKTDLGGAMRLSAVSRWSTGWHCHVHTFGHRTLRHLASGFTFATDPRNPANYVSSTVWLVVPEGAEPPSYSSELLLIGHAARSIRIAAGCVNYLQRHSGDRLPRPFFYHVEGDQFYYDDEDVPPLPRVTRFAEGVV
jgi:hypothetical protein